jgi:diaminopropionate ammonia-lyase
MAGLLLSARDPAVRSILGLDARSRVLAFGTGEAFTGAATG